MKNHILFLLMLIIASVIFSCSPQNPTANGGVWDEAENTLSVIVKDSVGKPVTNARIAIIPMVAWSQNIVSNKIPVFDSATTNAQGYAQVKNQHWPAQIEIHVGEKSSRLQIEKGQTNLPVTVKNSATLKGNFLPTAQLPLYVALVGTSYKASVNSDGSFEFKNIASGQYDLIAYKNQIQVIEQINLSQGSDTLLSNLEFTETSSILIDDFEDELPATRLHAFTGASWWYTSSDSISTISSKYETPNNIPESLINKTQKSLHVVTKIDSTVLGKYALCGFDINGSQLKPYQTHLFDLTSLDSLQFWIKGTGSVILQIHGTLPPLNTVYTSLSIDIPLDSNWQKVTLTPEQFTSKDSNISWSQISSSINAFSFLSSTSSDYWIDQIDFFGILITDILNQQ